MPSSNTTAVQLLPPTSHIPHTTLTAAKSEPAPIYRGCTSGYEKNSLEIRPKIWYNTRRNGAFPKEYLKTAVARAK
jgi:hypothetical protein